MLDEIRKIVLERMSEIDLEREFIIDSTYNNSFTYLDFFSLVRNLLNTKLFGNKEIIAIMDNSLELVVLYFATMISEKTVIIPIDPAKTESEIELIKRNHPDAVVVREYLNEQVGAGITKDEIMKLCNSIDFNRDYLITYTSGSTGAPKGVVHSLANLFQSALAFGNHISYNSEIVMCHVMPMTYMAGILNTIILPFVVGGKIVLFPRFSVKNAMKFWKNVLKYQINAFWLSPTMLHILMAIDKGEEIQKYFSERKIWFSVGTAPLSPKLKKDFEEKYNISIFVSYGLSETLFITSENSDSKSDESVGKMLQGVDIKLSEEKEILLNVPWLCKRYVSADLSQFCEDGFYCTGDLGELVGNELKIIGRKKELIIKGGMNIYPSEIEKYLLENFAIDEVCIGSVKFKEEERIVCWYVGGTLIENIINKEIINNLGKNYKIDFLCKLKELPKNLNGKVDKLSLIEKFGESYDN